ncbi:uncharacterized protein LOC123872468 [Maniola jurtina]|uniref:uncharacterized protein LOC123872468 n=1 Tax=Maniola jurtina TaxID=191418 RepID=UPI001E68C4DD|nr:uncharacterized protein LOC123872468 [Maniola jurtina]
MVHCNKCKLFVSLTKDDVIQCKGPCEAVYHKKCVREKSFFKKGICGGCQGKQEGGEIDVNLTEASPEGLLKELNKKLEIIYKMEKKLEDISEAVDFYAEQYQQMVKFKEEAEKKIKSLEQKNVYLDKCNKALEERVLDLEQSMKVNNVEIVGLEKQDNENTTQVVRKIAQTLKLDPDDITETLRVGRENDKKPQPVIVTLKTRRARDLWIKSRKNLLTNKDVYNNNSALPIYINEDLPRATRQLFWNAKNQLKGMYKYIWVQNSNILARKDNEKRIYRIRNDKDIEKLAG